MTDPFFLEYRCNLQLLSAAPPRVAALHKSHFAYFYSLKPINFHIGSFSLSEDIF